MIFEQAEPSTQLKAIGNRADYWIDSMAFTYLTAVTVGEKGMESKRLGTFYSVEDAIEFAEEYDKGKDE